MPKGPRIGKPSRHAVRNRRRNRNLARARDAANPGTQAGTSHRTPRRVLATDSSAATRDGRPAWTAPQAPRTVLASDHPTADPGGPAARTVLQAPRPAGTPAAPSAPNPRRLAVAATQPLRRYDHRGSLRGSDVPRRGPQVRQGPSAGPRLVDSPAPPRPPPAVHAEAAAARAQYHSDLAFDRAIQARRPGAAILPVVPPPPPAHHADVERHIVHGRLALLETHAAGLLHLVGAQSQALSIANWRLLALESAPPPLAPPSTASRLQAASDYQGQPTPTFDLRSTLAGHRRPAPEQSPVGSQPDFPPSFFGDGAAQAPPWSVATRPRIVSHPARLSRPADFLVPSWPPGDCPPPSAPLRRVLRREGSGINQLGSPSSAPGFVAPPNTVLPPPPHPPPSPPAPSSPDGGA